MSDWSLPDEVFTYLRAHLPQMGVTIVELGSGDGTVRLRELGRVISIEHDEAFLRPGPGIEFIYAPIVDGWYETAVIRGKLPAKYSCLVVDGPTGTIGRAGLLKHLDLFGDAPILVDDVHRAPERDLALALAKQRACGMSVHLLPNGRAFATIGFAL